MDDLEKLHLRINDVWKKLYEIDQDRKRVNSSLNILLSGNFEKLFKEIKEVQEKVVKWKNI